jgi:D-beta-D-heptose 7-phosphate kinase/D-beta-D-heptose 1-phosphate adenosyltransferase
LEEVEAMNKILTWEAMREVVNLRRKEGQTIAFTNGCFDILHVGHVKYLEAARRMGDLLILGLNSDASVRAIKGEKRPLVPQAERAEVVASLESVDYVTLFDETTPLRLIEYLQPDCIVKGGDWKEASVVGGDLVRARGGKVVIVPLIEGASTTNIVEKILQAYKKA